MSFDSLSKRYLRRFQETYLSAIQSGVTSIELATRPVVHDFIESLVMSLRPEVVVHHDTSVKGTRNRPDWRIEDKTTFGIYLYGDHKNLRLNGELELSDRDRDQISRYLELGRPVFVFDGIEFSFFDQDIDSPVRCLIIPKPLSAETKWERLPINMEVETKFRKYLETPGFRKWTEQELIQQLAHRAQFLAQSIEKLIKAPVDSGIDAAEEKLMSALGNLWKIIQKNHDSSLVNQRACAEFVAQVLTFGLFFAHTRTSATATSAEERHREIFGFWTIKSAVDRAGRLRPFRAIVDLLEVALSENNELAVWYTETISVLAHAEYMGTTQGPNDYHKLFEKFLEVFDNTLRFDFGAFYTPTLLTDWMARTTDDLLARHFEGQRIAQIAETVIDPCCGTGGFLEAMIKITDRSYSRIPQFVGFEILPAPYALAHYRLDKVVSGTKFQNNVKILLTDTLSDQLESSPGQTDGFSAELRDAIETARPPLRVVIGNPPSTNHVKSGAPRIKIDKMVEVFRPPVSERTDRQNVQKALRNEAYRFLRWCAQKVIDTGAGVVTLVLPGAFAYGVSFKYARRWMLENFDHFYVMHLDSDARTGDRTDSLFNVMQGRMVIFGVLLKRSGVRQTSKALVDVLDLVTLSKDQKEVFLASKSQTLTSFVRMEPIAPEWKLIVSEPYPKEVWRESWPLRDTMSNIGIFRSKCSALKLAPSSMLFHTDKAILLRRSAEIGAEREERFSYTFEQLKEAWWEGQSKPPRETKLTADVRKAITSAASDPMRTVLKYSFRPFVEGSIICDDSLFEALGDTSGGGTRARPEIRAAFSQGAKGIALAPAPIDLGSTMTRFASFVWHLPDNDIVARGNAMIYCDRYPEEQKGMTWDSSNQSNFSSAFESMFAETEGAEAALFYVYGVLSSGEYLSAFESVLYGSSNPLDPPRIPVAKDKKIRLEIAALGRKVAECERMDFEIETWSGLTAEWPPEMVEFELKDNEINVEAGTLTLQGRNGESLLVSGIPSSVLALRISGHDILPKWLREKRYPYLRRTFRRSDMRDLLGLISRMAMQQDQMLEIDRLVKKIISTDMLIAPPAI